MLAVTNTGINRTIRELLEYRARNTPDDVFAVESDSKITIRNVERSVNELANGFAELGVSPGDHVAVMMGNHIDHVFTLFALSKLGAVWVPVNVNLKGASLEWVFQNSAPRVVVADTEFWKQLEPVLTASIGLIVIRNGISAETRRNRLEFSKVANGVVGPPPGQPALEEVRTIMFTSGTTGPPKGALVTERMLQACAVGAGIASDVQRGDVFLVWEPIYHSGGAQICLLALRERITLAIVPRFSASRFWDQARRYGATKIHYLGGVVDILLKSPLSSHDKEHTVKIAFGGGCSPQNWRRFEKRFGIPIHEVYGLTEGSGFTTFNASGKVGSVGKPLPYMEVQIVDDDGKPLPTGQVGEIIIRGREPGLITKGYLGNPEATASALKGGWLHTGDLGRYDDDGDFFYLGRKTDSIRRRGENVSAWEVEHVLDSHPAIQESAVIGVKAEIGEQEIKAFIKLVPGATLDPMELIKWCEPRMPRYQIPRYIAFVQIFEKTGTLRIRKGTLPKGTDNCWDRERSSHVRQSA